MKKEIKQESWEKEFDNLWDYNGCSECGGIEIDIDKTRDFIHQEIQQERERQYELLMSCLPEDAENLSTLTDNQAGRLIRCFLKKKPWK